MKKIMLGLMLLFVPIFAVNASVGGNGSNLIEKVELASKSAVAYNGTLEISYKVTPSDAKDIKLTWSVKGLKDGITAKIKDSNTTNNIEGKISIEFKNETDKSAEIEVVAYNYTSNITKTVKVTVKSEEVTTKDVQKLSDLIISLPEEVTADNYDTVEKILGNIDTMLYENEGLENILDEDSLDKYNSVLNAFNEFETDKVSTGTIIIIVLLAISFILGLFIIFKKEK